MDASYGDMANEYFIAKAWQRCQLSGSHLAASLMAFQCSCSLFSLVGANSSISRSFNIIAELLEGIELHQALVSKYRY